MSTTVTNPIFINDVNTTTSVTTSPATIKVILWVSDDGTDMDIAINDNMKILDKVGGNVICSKRAEGAGDGLRMSFGSGIHVQGIYVSELDGGVLLLYV